MTQRDAGKSRRLFLFFRGVGRDDVGIGPYGGLQEVRWATLPALRATSPYAGEAILSEE